jgi:RNA polymerase sigma factor (sigma-70 family)
MLTPDELVGLLAAVANGDQRAFERLYAATRAKLYGVVLRILRRADLADEVMQDAYLKIWRSAGEFDSRLATPITWMVAIARNRALDVVRKKSEISIEDEPAALEAPATRRPNSCAGCSSVSTPSRPSGGNSSCLPISVVLAVNSSLPNSPHPSIP